MNSSCCFQKWNTCGRCGHHGRRMLQAVAEPHSIDQHDLHVTTSIGVSVYPDDGLDAETLIKNADTAMYQAKENGRQSYQFFKPAMNVRAVERQSIEESLRRALERQGIRAALPAEDRSEDGSDHRRGGIDTLDASRRAGSVPPGQFIPVAEACGLILPIGAWVLREACSRPEPGWMQACHRDHGRERLRDGVPQRKFPGQSVRNPQRNRPRPELARAGVDRRCPDEAVPRPRQPSCKA